MWLIAGLKVAVTASVPLTVMAQVVPLPVHAPDHPPKAEKVVTAPGASVSVTCVPLSKVAEHVPGQLMPLGVLVTIPVIGLVAVTVT